ncbi:hypothetical protein SASPL_108843 [Salvia splendens]|uniref:Bromo domain-containing protein n=2 Tax=Salvia splendens TaxID=180675 RepID=A0A8X8YD15_SALSN|nr:hypothetical protein SASPL_108843 [Salvia splendens]
MVSVDWRSLKQNQDHDHDGNGVMPAKHTLELVLDTLQRRDTYEIFAQPVDPNQVENYYEIVKEPMDFGTMRAKLHEGMYQNLQQFKHDVFLIPENAMHFNSSTTTYFRQARAIHDLANKVFHLLKTNPENFVEGTRRRSMRKTLCGSIPKPPASTFRPKTTGRLSNSRVEDRRRVTYLCKEDAAGSTTSKPLILGDISYEDSLMSYVKDLGPTAQMVAMRKLLGQHETKTCHKPKQFKTFRDFAPAGCNPFTKASNTARDGEEAKLEQKRKDKKATAVIKDLNCSSRPVILALENCHSEYKSRNKKSCNVSATPKPVCDEAAPQKPEKKHLPVLSRFTFDLPFFKARLEQINAVEMGLKRKKPGLSIYQ